MIQSCCCFGCICQSSKLVLKVQKCSIYWFTTCKLSGLQIKSTMNVIPIIVLSRGRVNMGHLQSLLSACGRIWHLLSFYPCTPSNTSVTLQHYTRDSVGRLPKLIWTAGWIGGVQTKNMPHSRYGGWRSVSTTRNWTVRTACKLEAYFSEISVGYYSDRKTASTELFTWRVQRVGLKRWG